MAWKKNSEEAVRRFEQTVAVPGATRKTMFGCPVFSIAGERYAVLHEERIALRLSPDDAAALIRAGGRAWEPIKGRASKGRFVVPESIAADDEALARWVSMAVNLAKAGTTNEKTKTKPRAAMTKTKKAKVMPPRRGERAARHRRTSTR